MTTCKTGLIDLVSNRNLVIMSLHRTFEKHFFVSSGLKCNESQILKRKK